MQVDFPLRLDLRGRTATASDDDHLDDLIEQVLFTSPGERVNRPDFGSGLMQLVLEPNREELATATQLLVQGSLQQWLGELIKVEDATVRIVDARLEVAVRYVVVRTQEARVARFSRSAA